MKLRAEFSWDIFTIKKRGMLQRRWCVRMLSADPRIYNYPHTRGLQGV